jgi:hypothetical protein
MRSLVLAITAKDAALKTTWVLEAHFQVQTCMLNYMQLFTAYLRPAPAHQQ